ncbi:MAG: sulfotransferase family 2 domain-containing protein [Candidatus Eremiobacteraeota bacterium]|nr:sulfotransferase family 2 domain-containing protein [Candidatus Eremiobacteraeota bacterium]
MSDEKYIFNHIPKTAGGSYIALLTTVLGPEQISPHVDLNQAGEDYSSLSAAPFDAYAVLVGHFGVRWHDRIGPNRRWLTALRAPVDRVLSTYYFWRNDVRSSPDLAYVELAQTLSLEGFVRCGDPFVVQTISNAQTWQLASDFRIDERKLGDNDALTQAKRNLDRFAFVGMFEEFHQSATMLCELLGFAVPGTLPKVHVSSDRLPLPDVPAATRALIEEHNQLDLELYAYARGRSTNIASPKE